MKVLHIGMGKTATSSLQAYVFPRLVESGQLGTYNPRELHLGLDAAVNGYVPEEGLADLAAAHDRMFISNETLLEWDPALWEASADRLFRIFGPDVTILITLRDPRSYLRSLYQQVLHHGKIRPPDKFFLPADTYRALRRFIRPGELDAIDVDAFDMVRMVSLFTARFNTVVLVPFERISELRFLAAIWEVPEAEREVLCDALSAVPRVNSSYSRLAVRLTLARERLLAGLGLRSRSTSDEQMRKALAHASGAVFVPSRSIIHFWNGLMRLLSRHGPRARYCLPNELYLGRHLDANAAFYDAVRQAPDGYVRFRRGDADGIDLTGFHATPSAAGDANG